MAFRVVKQDFWEDEKVVDNFSVEDKYFFLYLLTNPHSSQLGVYKLPLKIAAFECGYSKEQIIVLLDRFEKQLGIIQFNPETQEVAIGHFLYHSIVTGGVPVRKTVQKDLEKVKDKTLLRFIVDKMSVKTVVNKTVLEIIEDIKEYINYKNVNVNVNGNGNGESATESATESEKTHIPYSEIIDYLNKKTGKNFRSSTPKTQKFIKARWNEGFRLEDFFRVIDTKCAQWKSDKKMQSYLRPETLFGTKFEGYLNESPKKSSYGDLSTKVVAEIEGGIDYD